MISIGVVADARRGEMGTRLARQVEADYLSVDSGSLGCTGNHSAVWKWHADHPADWNVVLEEDALPVDRFRDQLTAALAVAPASIVSLYLGRGYIEDRRMEALLHSADTTGSHWVVAHGRILHAVALAVRGDLLPSMTTRFPLRRTQQIDRVLSQWARSHGHRVAYSVPSLVDHADEPSLVTRYRRLPRKAWRIGSRDDWSDRMIRMV